MGVEEDQIEELYKMIQDLIATANYEAESELHAAQLAQTQATNHLSTKETALTSATKKAGDASITLNDATQWLSDETARVSEEKSTLNEVRSLLEGLLETASN